MIADCGGVEWVSSGSILKDPRAFTLDSTIST